MKQKRDREEACFICGHYHDYAGGVPCSICGHVMAPHELKTQEAVIPTAIISGLLYLGSYDSSSRAEILKTMGITHCLNTVPTNQVLFRNTFEYMTVSTSPPDFQECFDFLDRLSQTDSKVLVYCMSGTSRSPTVVIGYLMKLRNWRLAESYKWVKSKRSSVHIQAEDEQRLIQLEMQLYGSTSVPQGLAALDLGSFGASGSGAQHLACAAMSHPPGAPVFGDASGQSQWSMNIDVAEAPVFGSGGTAPMSGGGGNVNM